MGLFHILMSFNFLNLEEIVTTVIANTDRLLEQHDVPFETAMRGLGEIMSDLAERWPECSEWIHSQLVEWIRRHTH